MIQKQTMATASTRFQLWRRYGRPSDWIRRCSTRESWNGSSSVGFLLPARLLGVGVGLPAGDWAVDGTDDAIVEAGNVEASLDETKDGALVEASAGRRLRREVDDPAAPVPLAWSGAIESATASSSSSLSSQAAVLVWALSSRRRAFSEVVPVSARTAPSRLTAP